MSEAAIAAIRCPTHKTNMVQCPFESQPPEEISCGIWWDCKKHRCFCSVLFPAEEAELRRRVKEAEAAIKLAEEGQ